MTVCAATGRPLGRHRSPIEGEASGVGNDECYTHFETAAGDENSSHLVWTEPSIEGGEE